MFSQSFSVSKNLNPQQILTFFEVNNCEIHLLTQPWTLFLFITFKIADFWRDSKVVQDTDGVRVTDGAVCRLCSARPMTLRPRDLWRVLVTVSLSIRRTKFQECPSLIFDLVYEQTPSGTNNLRRRFEDNIFAKGWKFENTERFEVLRTNWEQKNGQKDGVVVSQRGNDLVSTLPPEWGCLCLCFGAWRTWPGAISGCEYEQM